MDDFEVNSVTVKCNSCRMRNQFEGDEYEDVDYFSKNIEYTYVCGNCGSEGSFLIK
tara:strand:- start:224 stop:391 length:168 start_codon:yes stop_codon:yes gene_type:complete